MKVFILILILGLTLQIYILPQYSSIEVKENSYIYLDLSNYEKDIIYIDIDIYRNGTQKSANDETQYYLNIQLYYFFSNIIYSDGYHSKVIKMDIQTKEKLNGHILINSYINYNY